MELMMVGAREEEDQEETQVWSVWLLVNLFHLREGSQIT